MTDEPVTDDEPADALVSGLVYQMLAARADMDLASKIFLSAIADFGEGYAVGELFGKVLSGLLDVVDGIVDSHPQRDAYQLFFEAQAEIFTLTGDGDG